MLYSSFEADLEGIIGMFVMSCRVSGLTRNCT